MSWGLWDKSELSEVSQPHHHHQPGGRLPLSHGQTAWEERAGTLSTQCCNQTLGSALPPMLFLKPATGEGWRMPGLDASLRSQGPFSG